MIDFLSYMKEKYFGFVYYLDFSLKNFSTIKIGGIAKYVVFPSCEECFIELLNYVIEKGIRFKIVGNGSNLLFSDNGFNGMIIITKKLNKVSHNGTNIRAECGVLLPKLSIVACDLSLTGLEKFKMIPATVGGAVVMNAGDILSGILSYVSTVTYYFGGRVIKKRINDIVFSYRESEFYNCDKFILEVEFCLKPEDKSVLNTRMKNYENFRKRTQPYDKRSLGSVFKRSQNIVPAKLIDECGLKGTKIGDAVVSDKHSGFIINERDATSDNVKDLVKYIKQVVLTDRGIILTEEIEYFGD